MLARVLEEEVPAALEKHCLEKLQRWSYSLFEGLPNWSGVPFNCHSSNESPSPETPTKTFSFHSMRPTDKMFFGWLDSKCTGVSAGTPRAVPPT